MSDLLTRLAARATGAPPRVQPVLASRYEPAPFVPGNLVEPSEAPVATDAPPTKPEPRQMLERAEAVGESRPLAPSRREAGREPEPPERMVELQPERVTVPPAAEPARRTSTPISRLTRSSRPERTIEPPVAATMLPDTPVPPLQPTATVREVQQPASPTRLITENARPIEAHVPPASERLARASEQPPPDVQITIGHIELRMAAPRPVVQQPRRPFQPRVTLDEYLRRQNGGSR